MLKAAVAILALSLVIACAASAQAERRVALLVGNEAYANAPRLNTAVNDVRAIGAVLRKLGFSVIIAENRSRLALSEAFFEFDAAIEPGDLAFFFFAGHGFEIHGQNYLLPVDAPAGGDGREELIKDSSFTAEHIIDRIQKRGARTTIIVLDACRNNPFERQGGRDIGRGGGLAPMKPVQGVFIIFSAGAKQIALDQLAVGENAQNSLFTRNFMQQLQEPGLTLVQIAKRLQSEIRKIAATVGHEQTPAYYDQVVGDIVLNPAIGRAQPQSADDPHTSAVTLPSTLGPPRLWPDIAATTPENPVAPAVQELDALAAARSWRELTTHLTAVKPTERDAHWTSLVEQAAVGELTRLATSSDPFAERLAVIERYLSMFPSLQGSEKILALRTSLGLTAFRQCFEESHLQAHIVQCYNGLENFVRAPPRRADLAIGAARLVRVRVDPAAAASFFAIATEASQGASGCTDTELPAILIAALRTPPDESHAKAARALADMCWDSVSTSVVAQVAREEPNSHYLDNTCPTLMKRSAVTGLRAARCQKILSR
jgi:hypothetical protein